MRQLFDLQNKDLVCQVTRKNVGIAMVLAEAARWHGPAASV